MLYYLDGHEVKTTDDILEWGRTFDRSNRRVAETMVGDIRVSTVFLGFDHSYSPTGPPVLFQTMIFAPDNDDLDQWCDRYSNWQEAEAGHNAVVQELTQGTWNQPA